MNRFTRTLGSSLAVLSLCAPALAQSSLPQAGDSYFRAAQEQLARLEARQPNTGKAKNVILFVVDGLSVPTITAARILEGQLAGRDGASNLLGFETVLPYTALSRTYTHDSIVADSAPTATALVSGVKALNGTIGVNQNAVPNDARTQIGNEVTTLFEQAEEAGLATGIVSTARITHATPAATYAKVAGRDWENDTQLTPEAVELGVKDIAAQLIDWPAGDGFEVVFGGGRSNFMLESQADPEYETRKGARVDRDLVGDWQAAHNDGAYVWNREQFDALGAGTTRVLGLFEPSHMQYEADREKDAGGEPSIAEMTVKAIEILSRNEKGFVLQVEGGRVDHAHHAGNAARALTDAIAVSEAVEAAYNAVDPEETLIVLTADHSHVFSIAGYPTRDTSILGVGGIADDGKPYTILGYQNGPGARLDEPRADLTDVDTTDIDFLQPALVPLESETHAGDDVAIYAQGPWAHLFHGALEQNVVYHVMAKAIGLDGSN